MDKRWEELDNPAATAQRQEVITAGDAVVWTGWPTQETLQEEKDAFWAGRRLQRLAMQAKQEQEVVDKRAAIEQFAQMLKDHRAKGEEIELFAQNNDIPGFCGWDGIENWTHSDPVDVALSWAASDHSC